MQSVFPDFDDTLRQAFRRETELFFESIVREDRSALDLLRADYTFLNERLAAHYGIPNVKGSRFRRVTLPPDSRARRPARAGQHPDGDVISRSDVAGRARQVDPREPARHAAAAAAARVPPLKPPSSRRRFFPMRQRMEQHRRQPVVRVLSRDDGSRSACRSRTSMRLARGARSDESSAQSMPSGAMPDGTKFDGAGRAAAGTAGSDRFVATLTEKMLTYALGRGLEYYDAPSVRGNPPRRARATTIRFVVARLAGSCRARRSG